MSDSNLEKIAKTALTKSERDFIFYGLKRAALTMPGETADAITDQIRDLVKSRRESLLCAVTLARKLHDEGGLNNWPREEQKVRERRFEVGEMLRGLTGQSLVAWEEMWAYFPSATDPLTLFESATDAIQHVRGRKEKIKEEKSLQRRAQIERLTKIEEAYDKERKSPE